jgi:hypothetical protein
MAAQMAAFMNENRQQTVSDNGCSDDSNVTAYTGMCAAEPHLISLNSAPDQHASSAARAASIWPSSSANTELKHARDAVGGAIITPREDHLQADAQFRSTLVVWRTMLAVSSVDGRMSCTS